MNKVLFVGNGFDLAHGLRTSYGNFLNVMKNKGVFSMAVDYYLKTGKPSDTSKFYKYFKDVKSLNEDNIKKLQEILKNNSWVKYFSECEAEIDGWIDFEREISTVLHSFQAFLPSLSVRFGGKDIPNDMIHRYVLTTFNFFYEKKSEAGISSTGRAVDSEYSVKKEFMLEYPLGSKNRVINKEKIIETLERALLE